MATSTKRKPRKKPVKDDGPLVPAPTNRQLRNREAKRRFIEALGKYGTITRACKEAGISRVTYYLWTNPKIAENYNLDPAKHFDPEFLEASNDAYLNRFQDRVLDVGYHRALDGWTDYHYDRFGNVVKEEEKYDSAVLQMLMKRADPQLKDKSGDINVDLSQQNLHVHESSAVTLDKLTPQQKKLLLKAASLQVQNTEGQGSVPALIEGETIPQEKANVPKNRRTKTSRVSSSS